MIEKIGKYTIIEQIGKVSMGIVYKARDPEIRRMVAIKTIHLPEGSAAEQQELILRLKQEAHGPPIYRHGYMDVNLTVIWKVARGFPLKISAASWCNPLMHWISHSGIILSIGISNRPIHSCWSS